MVVYHECNCQRFCTTVRRSYTRWVTGCLAWSRCFWKSPMSTGAFGTVCTDTNPAWTVRKPANWRAGRSAPRVLSTTGGRRTTTTTPTNGTTTTCRADCFVRHHRRTNISNSKNNRPRSRSRRRHRTNLRRRRPANPNSHARIREPDGRTVAEIRARVVLRRHNSAPSPRRSYLCNIVVNMSRNAQSTHALYTRGRWNWRTRVSVAVVTETARYDWRTVVAPTCIIIGGGGNTWYLRRLL